MIKVNIKNMKGFLRAVNECRGAVNVLYPDGRKVNINKQEDNQEELRQKHIENKYFLRISLEIPDPKDYFYMVIYSVGNN